LKFTLVVSITLNALLASLVLFLANRLGYLGRAMVAFGLDPISLPTDILVSRPEWQDEVKNQISVTRNQRYDVCLLGDSISSGLGNSFGSKIFNFAITGMSTISQIEQLKLLIAAQIKCNTVLLAIGTNDAAYRSTDEQFVRNMKTILRISKNQMDTRKFVILPAFYSTIAASHDLKISGPLHRVNRINELIQDIAVQEKALFMKDGLEALYEGQALKQSLTTDGVHLNSDGEKIYRDALLKVIFHLSTS
jgi:lysophospholipase L1-like esterase